MLYVPIRPAERGTILFHAGFTGLEQVVGSESTGKNAQTKLEMSNAIARHASNGVFQLFGRDKGCVVS